MVMMMADDDDDEKCDDSDDNVVKILMKMITSTASRMESMGKELKHLPITVITFGWSTFAQISCS